MANPIPNLFRVPELKDKILFTLLCLLIYRIGAHITAPGVDVGGATRPVRTAPGHAASASTTCSRAAALSRATVFALGIMPYISASIFADRGGGVPSREDAEGRRGPEKDQPVDALRDGRSRRGAGAGASRSSPSRCRAPWRSPGFGFRLQMALFLTTGAIFVMWLGEQITERGIGNGASLMIFFSIVERIWPGIVDDVRVRQHGRDRRVLARRARRHDGRASSPASSR